MAGNMFVAGSSSSSNLFPLTAELFGSKDSSSSKDIIVSIFGPPPSKILGRESVPPEVKHETNQDSKVQKSSSAGMDNGSKKKEDDEKGGEKDHEQWWMSRTKGILQPCQLSSSIYYGGQEFYPYSPPPQTSGATYKSDGVENPDIATGGNWWQGSLYY